MSRGFPWNVGEPWEIFLKDFLRDVRGTLEDVPGCPGNHLGQACSNETARLDRTLRLESKFGKRNTMIEKTVMKRAMTIMTMMMMMTMTMTKKQRGKEQKKEEEEEKKKKK